MLDFTLVYIEWNIVDKRYDKVNNMINYLRQYQNNRI